MQKVTEKYASQIFNRSECVVDLANSTSRPLSLRLSSVDKRIRYDEPPIFKFNTKSRSSFTKILNKYFSFISIFAKHR